MAEKVQTILDAQQKLIEEFEYFEDWSDRYRFIIDLGRKLEAFPKEWMIDEYKVRGCQSQVWLKPDTMNGKLVFYATSDAAIVSGLISIVLKIYNYRTPQEIIATPPDFIKHIGLSEHLSQSRTNGLHSFISNIFHYAKFTNP
ncbi:MAG: Fe-S cluster assembly protein SufE [Magnetovibrio sp.]|nr:Fe-S cluster assembly protein SufE [Magnetovibrio sp.]|tara:strand:- start:34 stop:462 length:429 start_codon:yes stop_codon:yes gene_type:complete